MTTAEDVKRIHQAQRRFSIQRIIAAVKRFPDVVRREWKTASGAIAFLAAWSATMLLLALWRMGLL